MKFERGIEGWFSCNCEDLIWYPWSHSAGNTCHMMSTKGCAILTNSRLLVIHDDHPALGVPEMRVLDTCPNHWQLIETCQESCRRFNVAADIVPLPHATDSSRMPYSPSIMKPRRRPWCESPQVYPSDHPNYPADQTHLHLQVTYRFQLASFDKSTAVNIDLASY